MSHDDDYQQRLQQLERKREQEAMERAVLERVRQELARSPAQQGEKGEPGKSSTLVQAAALVAAITALVTAVGAILKPAPDTKAAEGYAALRAEFVKTNEAIQKNGQNDEIRYDFLTGLFKALPGIKLTESPGSPPIEPVQLQPAPRRDPRSRAPVLGAPAVQVKDPVPAPVSSIAPVQLPKDLAAVPSLKK